MQKASNFSIYLKKNISRNFRIKNNNGIFYKYPVLAIDVLTIDRTMMQDIKLSEDDALVLDDEEIEEMENKKVKKNRETQEVVMFFLIPSLKNGEFKWVDSKVTRYAGIKKVNSRVVTP